MKYHTIVADPPWELTAGPNKFSVRKTPRGNEPDERHNPRSRPLPYPTMTVEEIKALPIPADDNAHLYLWTTNKYLESAYEVARAWGFRPAQVLVWVKTPRGLGLGGTFSSTTEFVLFCRRGTLTAKRRIDTSWWNWTRPEQGTGPMHSRKPEAFLDIVEQVSPGPYLELFARRNRLGWHAWGNECQSDIEIAI